MNIIAIIPARMGSSRFPGKPLADIHGLPTVLHVALRTRLARCLDAVYVATCDQEIADVCTAAGVPAIMTSPAHERCSDRTAEALLHIEEASGHRADIVVMVQGDEPMITPDMIEAAVAPLLHEASVQVVNLMEEMASTQEFEDPNEVKVVVDAAGDALYFSREPLPSRKKGATTVPMREQVCIIAFRREALLHFNDLPDTPLERIESVDMLRLLEHGEKVRMVAVPHRTFSVDTPEDLRRVRELMRKDPLFAAYYPRMEHI